MYEEELSKSETPDQGVTELHSAPDGCPQRWTLGPSLTGITEGFRYLSFSRLPLKQMVFYDVFLLAALEISFESV